MGASLLTAFVAIALLAGCSTGAAPRPPALSGSTLEATYVDRNGDGVLERGPGEPLVARTELSPRARPLRQLAFFTQIADAHIVDEESPARLEPLDRLGPPFTSAFRPQEASSGQVLDATIRSLRRLRPQAVVFTGDLIDNAQANELDEALAILHGGRVNPDSGARGYDGVQSAANPDPFYYRPDVDPPVQLGLLAAAERPFTAAGLHLPWYPLVGNHDLLAQGNFAPTARTRAIAIGNRKLVRLDASAAGLARARVLAPRAVDRLLARGLPGTSIRVPADPHRREVGAAEVLRRLRTASGHGGSGPLLDYAFDLGPRVRAIVLDTVRRDFGAGGRLRPGQTAWLRRALHAAGKRWVIVFSSNVLPDTDGAGPALALLDADSHVVAAVTGDKHRNSIAPRQTAGGGYWLITTSSLIDFPQQARAFRLMSTRGGGVVLETWMVDHADRVPLTRVSRELAFLDYQERAQGGAGGRRDRNAALYR